MVCAAILTLHQIAWNLSYWDFDNRSDTKVEVNKENEVRPSSTNLMDF